MPVVPILSGPTVQPSPLPSVRHPVDAPLAAFQKPPSLLEASADAVAQVGLPIAQAYLQKAKDHADQVATMDADNQAAELARRISETVQGQRGKDAVGAVGDADASWQTGVALIRARLRDGTQRDTFDRMAASRAETLRDQITRHATTEMDRYDAEQTDLGVKNAITGALSNYDNPDQVATAIGQLAGTLDGAAARHPGEHPPGWVDEQIGDYTSQIRAGVIGRYLSAGNVSAAQAYYDAHRADLRPAQAEPVDRALRTATVDNQGYTLASSVWDQLGPKGINDPTRIADMEQAVRDQQSDPSVVRSAITELRSRAQAQNAQQTELRASDRATLLGLFNQGTPISAITARPEYRELSGADQEDLTNYMRKGRQERLEVQGFAAYERLSDPMTLAGMTETQILAEEPTLGQSLVADLMKQKRSLGSKNENIRAATVDADLFSYLLRDMTSLDPSNKADAEDVGRIRYAVESAIDQEQTGTGKELPRARKEEITRNILSQHVMVAHPLGAMTFRDQERIAATVREDERRGSYAPRPDPQVKPDDAKTWDTYASDAIGWMREQGLIPAGVDDRTAIVRNQGRIEQAIAAQLLGASPDSVYAILRGAP